MFTNEADIGSLPEVSGKLPCSKLLHHKKGLRRRRMISNAFSAANTNHAAIQKTRTPKMAYTITLSPSLFDLVGQFADAFDFTGDHIAGFQEFRGLKTHTYPSGSTHGNDGACL